MPTRRDALRLTLGAALAPALPAMPAIAQGRSATAQGRASGGGPLEVEVNDANLRPRPIAVPPFLSDDAQLGQEVAQIIAAAENSSPYAAAQEPSSTMPSGAARRRSTGGPPDWMYPQPATSAAFPG